MYKSLTKSYYTKSPKIKTFIKYLVSKSIQTCNICKRGVQLINWYLHVYVVQ